MRELWRSLINKLFWRSKVIELFGTEVLYKSHRFTNEVQLVELTPRHCNGRCRGNYE